MGARLHCSPCGFWWERGYFVAPAVFGGSEAIKNNPVILNLFVTPVRATAHNHSSRLCTVLQATAHNHSLGFALSYKLSHQHLLKSKCTKTGLTSFYLYDNLSLFFKMKGVQMSLSDQNQQLKSFLNKLDILPYTKYASIVRQIKVALDNGADINTPDDNGNTLLHITASNKNLKAYRAYINQTLAINKEAKSLYTIDISTLIADYKPNPFILNKNGLTASVLAAQNNFSQENALLLSYEKLYHATNHQSKEVLIAHSKLKQMNTHLNQQIQLGTRQKND